MTAMTHQRYPLNCWYVAATKAEINAEPTCLWLLGRLPMMFPTQAGEIAALDDRCAVC